MKRWNLAAAVAVTVLLTVAAARAESATEIYNAVKSRIQSAKDYVCNYEYHGPAGQYKFEYRCVRPGDIYTHIV
ncbi:MAG: hypothetical protein ACYCW6_23165, partial [Candidatus Xenobia bacterium]